VVEKVINGFPFLYNVLKGQVLSPVKVCEESEVATNLQLYEIKQMSFAIKLYLKNDTALTNTFFYTIFKDITGELNSRNLDLSLNPDCTGC
jgi:hypothetical protein